MGRKFCRKKKQMIGWATYPPGAEIICGWFLTHNGNTRSSYQYKFIVDKKAVVYAATVKYTYIPNFGRVAPRYFAVFTWILKILYIISNVYISEFRCIHFIVSIKSFKAQQMATWNLIDRN